MARRRCRRTAGLRARHIESPNRDERPRARVVSLIVVHAISLPPAQFGGDGIVRCLPIDSTLLPTPTSRRSAALRVSAHFLFVATAS
jgi:AmpD protein